MSRAVELAAEAEAELGLARDKCRGLSKDLDTTTSERDSLQVRSAVVWFVSGRSLSDQCMHIVLGWQRALDAERRLRTEDRTANDTERRTLLDRIRTAEETATAAEEHLASTEATLADAVAQRDSARARIDELDAVLSHEREQAAVRSLNKECSSCSSLTD